MAKILVIPKDNHTRYLYDRAVSFIRDRSAVKIFETEEDLEDVDLMSLFVLKGFRREAEILNDMRRKTGLPELFIVEVPLPSPRQRVIRNKTRARIARLLSGGPLHGYEIYKRYRETFGKINVRLIYYHLERGVKEGIFEVVDVKEEQGDFSWGTHTKRKYYRLTL